MTPPSCRLGRPRSVRAPWRGLGEVRLAGAGAVAVRVRHRLSAGDPRRGLHRRAGVQPREFPGLPAVRAGQARPGVADVREPGFRWTKIY